MGDTFVRLNPDEFVHIGVRCTTCASELVFNADAQRGPGEVSCQNCGKAIPHAETIIHAYRRFREHLKAANAPVVFLTVPHHKITAPPPPPRDENPGRG